MVPVSSGPGASRPSGAALAVALYLTALALIAQGIAEGLSVGGAAASLGSLRWRFGFLGLVFNYLPYPLFGVALGAMTAAQLRHRRILGTVAILQGLAGLGGLAALLIFSLDATQLAATVPTPLKPQYVTTVVETFVTGCLGVGLFLALAFASGRALRLDPAPERRKGRDASVLVGNA